MTNEIFREQDLAIEVITSGSTLDNDPGYRGKTYRISTWTFRINHVGLNEWISSEPIYWNPWDYETREEFEEEHKAREEARETLMNQIREQLDGKEGTQGFTVTQNVSEVFTAVLIEEEKAEQPKTATIAERLQRQRSMMNALLCYMI